MTHFFRRFFAVWCLGLTVLAGTVSGQPTMSTMYHVDSVHGSDANPGTEARPWKTIAYVNTHIPALQPGDRILLRRGSRWSGETLTLQNVRGTASAPIIIGAYGPNTAPRPSIGHGRITVRNSEHLVIRDLEVHHSPSGPCIAVSHSGYLTVINNVVHHAQSNGIAYHASTHHTATIDNIVHDILANDGVSIHDANWGEHPGPVGSHHWVIDNLFPGNYWEDAIDVATEDHPHAPSGRDIKIIGNRIYGARLAGIVAQHQCRYVWVMGNTIMGCGTRGAKALSLGKLEGDGLAQASGNLLIDNPRSVRLRDRVDFHHNTIIHRHDGPAILVYENADGMRLERNLVLTAGAPWIEVRDALPDISRLQSHHNWFGLLGAVAGVPSDAFLYQGRRTTAEWQHTLEEDTDSRFGTIAGMRIPDTIPTDVTLWDATTFRHCIPPPVWDGHADAMQMGALGPDGNRRGMVFTPFADYEVNDGYGWPGPAIVQARYPMRR